MIDQLEIKEQIDDAVQDIIENATARTDRETLIEIIDQVADDLYGSIVQTGWIANYTVDDLVKTAPNCSAIIEYAEQNAWVDDDEGLWEGVTFGVLGFIAHFSLRNCVQQALEDRGIDVNDDHPFASDYVASMEKEVYKFLMCLVNDEELEITIASDDGTAWVYQTGDNSFRGDCYGVDNWGTGTIGPDVCLESLAEDLVNQVFEELL